MEIIKDFSIELELDDCEWLYDYGRGEYYRRPASGTWDLAFIKKLSLLNNVSSPLDEDPPNKDPLKDKICVQLMDRALTRWGAMETDIHKTREKTQREKEEKAAVEEKSPKHKKIGDIVWESLDERPGLPKRVMPVYRPGELVRGHVNLVLKEKMQLDKFYATFKGGARVLIRCYNPKGFHDDYGSEKYVDEETVFWKRESADMDSVREDLALLSCEDEHVENDDDGKTLPAGTLSFPFIYTIPSDAPASVPPLINSSTDFAHVLYRLKAVIDKGKLLRSGNIVCGHAIWVNRDYDIGTVPGALSPITAEEVLTTGLFRSNQVCCKATISKRAFVRGESVPLALVVENADSTGITSVTARVHLTGSVKPGTQKFRQSRSINLKSAKITTESVPADSVEQLQLKLPLNFEEIDDHLIPAGTLSDCALIDGRYEVVVKLKRKGLHRTVELKIPITIGTENAATDS